MGVRNPSTSWQNIRKWAQKNWTEEQFALLPEHLREKKKPTVEMVYDESIAEEYRREQEAKKAAEEAKTAEMIREEKPLNIINGHQADENTSVTAIRTEVGEFYFDRRYRTIDWRSESGDEISMAPEDWKKLAVKIPEMMQFLDAEV